MHTVDDVVGYGPPVPTGCERVRIPCRSFQQDGVFLLGEAELPVAGDKVTVKMRGVQVFVGRKLAQWRRGGGHIKGQQGGFFPAGDGLDKTAGGKHAMPFGAYAGSDDACFDRVSDAAAENSRGCVLYLGEGNHVAPHIVNRRVDPDTGCDLPEQFGRFVGFVERHQCREEDDENDGQGGGWAGLESGGEFSTGGGSCRCQQHCQRQRHDQTDQAIEREEENQKAKTKDALQRDPISALKRNFSSE